MHESRNLFRKLDSAKVIGTLERLDRRISERFPGAGLQKVCADLTDIAAHTRERSLSIGRPDYRLRTAIASVVALGALALGALMWGLVAGAEANGNLYDALQGIDSGFNIVVVMIAALVFLATLEERLKRHRALKALHELRSIIHVIDMHQLTKDPWTEANIHQPTPSSPTRDMTPVELVHYLNYCSEMLSLASKVAVLYAESFPDPVVTETVNDLERTAASLAQKVWQKINILTPMIDDAPEQMAELPGRGGAALPASVLPKMEEGLEQPGAPP